MSSSKFSFKRRGSNQKSNPSTSCSGGQCRGQCAPDTGSSGSNGGGAGSGAGGGSGSTSGSSGSSGQSRHGCPHDSSACSGNGVDSADKSQFDWTTLTHHRYVVYAGCMAGVWHVYARCMTGVRRVYDPVDQVYAYCRV